MDAEWLLVKVGSVDDRFVNVLRQWRPKDSIVRTGDSVPVVWVPSLRVAFVVVSALKEHDPLLQAWNGLEQVPANWERFVVLYGLYRRRNKEVEYALPLFVLELIDGDVRYAQFDTMRQAAEFVARVIDRRRRKHER